MSLKTPLEMFYQWEQTHPDTIYLKQPIDGVTKDFTWRETGQQARKVAESLLVMNLPKGSHIAILSKNCAEWFITDLAIMLAGHVSVPIYSTAGEKTIKYVLDHAKCPVIFVGKLDNTEKQVAAIDDGIVKLAFPYPNIPADKQWDELLQTDPFLGKPIPALDSIMSIVYTSGSTGNPKGVVHNYESMCWAASNSLNELGVDQNDRILSYLPLAHITERVLVEIASFYSGSRIDFIESLDTFARDVRATQPTLFISVPRLWTRFQMGVLANMPQKKLDFLLRVPIVGGIVSKKIRTKLGLGQARLCASGSAPIPATTLEWFRKIGINISEGWGMTENSAYGTCCVPFRADKLGSIGRAYSGVDIRIAEEGEIQVKGPCNMKEYYLEPEKTAEVMTEDGYLKTGDKGSIDSEGYIKITGRLKEIFKTSKGKYIAPVPIESKLMANSSIEQVCVTGSQLKQPIGLVVLSVEALKLPSAEIEMSLLATLNEVNNTLESHAVLDCLVVMKDEWTVDNGLLTPTLKVKRHNLEEHYKDLINGQLNGKIVRQ
ncbi:AMP-binding protein [Paraglaciecola psychrophila]|jgi:long-chain acyl-CoA synthetase|uniref:AMP-dependent synthetase and ligase n=1 Tax=Paraglaciecola psychrophila 170 TaxID=1129794 RepID=K7ADC0_9ALTE|nr:AMP-binding protein [Paraglaciecola psychrophila]AGH46618.1 AMP-dependent synthetase and ligase [Paraglaciecola psychrophila 170]GAC38663.1 AMP-binding protein [Paraglaciecola psychrophila 170]